MSWEITPLSAFLTEREGRIKHAEANSLGLRRVTKIDFSGQIHLDDTTDTKTDMIRVQRGDLLISGINAAKGAISVHEEDEEVLATIHYSAYSYDPEQISVEFLKWFFKSPEFTELLKQQVSGGIKTELKPKHILPLRVRIPKLREQEAIAARLNGIENEQAKLEREIVHQEDLVAKLKQAILQEAITGRLTAGWRAANPKIEPAGQLLARIRAEKARLVAAKKLRPEKPLPPIAPDDIPFCLPETWAWCRYGDLCEYVTSGSRGWQAYYADSGALFIRAQNIKTDRLVLDDEAFVALPDHAEGTRAKVLRNDVLVTITGGNLAKTALVEDDFEEAYVSQHIALTRLVDTRLARWIHQALTTDRGPRAYLLALSRGDKPGLNLPNVRSVTIPIPPLAEQAEIVSRVEALMGRCRELEAEIAGSRAHAESLLPAVLREAFAPAATPIAIRLDRPSIKPLAYLLQFLPALARAAGGTVTLDQLNRATACLFLPKAELLPVVEKIAGAKARDHFTSFAQSYEEGSFLAAIRTLLRTKALVLAAEHGSTPLLRITDDLPPIAHEIDADARYLAPIIARVPETIIARTAPRMETHRPREALLQHV